MARQIGSGDIEHYYGGIILTVAQTLTEREWNSLTHASKQRLLKKGLEVVKAIMNNPIHQSSLRIWLRDRSDYEAAIAAVRTMVTIGIPSEKKWP